MLKTKQNKVSETSNIILTRVYFSCIINYGENLKNVNLLK